ncbi:MAG: non-canonical purine NTP pyrophosphatase, RdgB/HAM1 family [Magnetovibrio sp.]|nr:non-canonical purine NTP pyrophosphatase, RdgB/HAM1 family [Magnetovibrio sp.]
MLRSFKDKKIIIASHNSGKVQEFKELFEPYDLEIIPASKLNLAEPIENGDTFVENAEIKAVEAATAASLPALSDDSGLVVPAIGGKPGIHSARWAGPNKNFTLAMETVWNRLANKNPSAYFVCALSICWPQEGAQTLKTISFKGRVDGRLVWPPRGANGFGYDPIFMPEGYDITFGEFGDTEKQAISHRTRAFEKFSAACLVI